MNWRDYIPDSILPRAARRHSRVAASNALDLLLPDERERPRDPPNLAKSVWQQRQPEATADSEYYLLVIDNSPDYPRLKWFATAAVEAANSTAESGNDLENLTQAPLPDFDAGIELCLDGQLPGKPRWGDFHWANTPVVSQAVFDLLAPQQLPGVEFVPARIHQPGAATLDGYYAMLVDNEFACLDRAKASFRADEEGYILELSRIVLDAQVLKAMDPRQRSLFKLEESANSYIFHRSSIDLLRSRRLQGGRFVALNQWRSDDSI